MKMKSQSPITVWIVVRFSEEEHMQNFTNLIMPAEADKLDCLEGSSHAV